LKARSEISSWSWTKKSKNAFEMKTLSETSFAGLALETRLGVAERDVEGVALRPALGVDVRVGAMI
jgi:hypothetical protein